MASNNDEIENTQYSQSAIIFLLIGLIVWILILSFAIYITQNYWSRVRNIWKIMSIIFMFLLSPLISIIFILLGIAEKAY
jgi:hypothetical protein